MVERINKPDAAPPAYSILPTKETDEDKSRQEDQNEEESESYQKSENTTWNKFSNRALQVKAVKTKRDRIDKILFGRVFLRAGFCVLEGTVIWKDGRKTEPALFMLPKREDFMRLKTFVRGKEVPESFWSVGEEIQFGILEAGSITGSWGIREIETHNNQTKKQKINILKILKLVDINTNEFQWFTLGTYIVISTIILLIIYHALA